VAAVIEGDCQEIRRLAQVAVPRVCLVCGSRVANVLLWGVLRAQHPLFPLDLRDYSFPHDAPTPLQVQ